MTLERKRNATRRFNRRYFVDKFAKAREIAHNCFRRIRGW